MPTIDDDESEISRYAFLRYKFFRPLNWRYEYARRMVSAGHGVYIPSDEDACTIQIARLLAMESELTATLSSGLTHQRLRQQYGDLHAAYLLFKDPRYGQLKFEIECRLLAGQADDCISLAYNLPPTVVEFYEQGFYDVRERLSASDYICAAAGFSSLRHDHELPAATIKRFAYFGGMRVLEPLLLVLAAEHDSFTEKLWSSIQSNARLSSLLSGDCLQPIGIQLRSLCEQLVGRRLDAVSTAQESPTESIEPIDNLIRQAG